LPFDPQFKGSNPAEGSGFLMEIIKIHSMPSFREDIKLSAPCCKILWHVKDPFEV
jgi:hypothetical protein